MHIQINTTHGPDGFQLMGTGLKFKQEVCDMIAGTRLFSDFAWKDIELLSDFVQCYEVAAGTVIFNEGEPGSYMCLVIKGQIEILKEHHDGKLRRIVLVGAGKTVGEMSIIDSELRSATCIAFCNSVLLLLTKENYGRIIKEKPSLAVNILARLAKLMSQRLRGTSGQLVEYLEEEDS